MSKAASERNGYVTWKAFLMLLGAAISVPILTNWAVVERHAAQPHSGAVHARELDKIEEAYKELQKGFISIKLRTNRIEQNQEHILKRLEERL